MGGAVAEVRRFLARHGVAGRGVVAVSGGADSVALLRALVDAGADRPVVAHFNHRLRGGESDGDEAFVRGLAGRLGLEFRATARDLAAEAAGAGENLEAAARRLRYDWLRAAAGQSGAAWIATGHTANDQAETVLHRLIRGTGIQGLRGIAGVRPPAASPETGDSVRIIRPLLTVTRREVLAYLETLGQPYRTDSSNADTRFTRNRIRHELLPLLATFNPEIVAVLGRLAGQADEAFGQLRADAAGLLAAAERPRAGDVLILDAAALAAAPPHRARDALRLVWEREGWPANGMTFAHWDRAAAIARGDHPAADFPDGVHVRRAGRVVQLSRRV